MTPEQKYHGGLVALVGEEELVKLMAKQQQSVPTHGEHWLQAMNQLWWIDHQAKKKEQGE